VTVTGVAALQLPRQIRQAMLAHAAFCHPFEACGLIAFDDRGKARFVYALTNRARSSSRYLVDPTEHFRAIQHAESLGWTIGGAFHSHPEGPAIPSPVDVAEARDPLWVYLVTAADEVRAWSIDGRTTEVPVEVV
jgi:proteasome lid subunit RPN8/RPN11